MRSPFPDYPETFTVAELIAELQKYDPDTLVYTDGCFANMPKLAHLAHLENDIDMALHVRRVIPDTIETEGKMEKCVLLCWQK